MTGSGGVSAARTVEVDAARIQRWLGGFAERHGAWQVVHGDSGGDFEVVAEDGATASFRRFEYPGTGVILVRRGGYAVALLADERIVASRVGTRYVQSRTAAGGWSQQRFARRRDGQAAALVDAVAGHALAVILGGDADGTHGIPAALILGGDRHLLDEVLDDRRLRRLAGLVRRELLDLPDPRRAVLEAAVRRGRAVRITVTERAGTAQTSRG